MPKDTSSRLTREDRFCLLLSRGQLTPEEEVRALEFLSAPLAWSLFLDRGYVHQVYPLLYRNLRQLGFPGVPEAVQAELNRAYQANGLRNQILSEELDRLLCLLNNADIHTIPLNGVRLTESLYGDLSARVCADIDLLVPPVQFQRGIEVILSAGYPDVLKQPFFRKLRLRYGHHYAFQRNQAGHSSVVELRSGLLEHSRHSNEIVNDLWAEVWPRRSRGMSAYAFSREWEVLYLAVRANARGWRGLKLLVDVHQLCMSRPPDWECLMEKAKQFALDSVIRRTLAACSVLFGTPLPEGFAPVSLPARVRFFPLTPVPAGVPEAAFFPLMLLQRSWDKLHCAAKVLFVPKPADQDFLHLTAALRLAYYPSLVVRLIGKRVKRFVVSLHPESPVEVPPASKDSK